MRFNVELPIHLHFFFFFFFFLMVTEGFSLLSTRIKQVFRVSRFAKKNRMEIHNLAIVFGPSLFSAGADALHKGKKGEKKNLEATGVQNNSHFVFNMIMQGQILEYLLTEFDKFTAFHEASIEETSV